MENDVTRLVSNKGYSVLKSSISRDTIVRIKRELTVQQVSSPDFPPLKPFGIYEETQNYLRLPVNWATEEFGQPQRILFADVPTTNLNFTSSLRPAQEDPAEKSITHLKRKGRGILCLVTGGGKTVTSLYIACQMKQKTLVIVHKRSLIEQWRDEIKKHIPDARVGTYCQKVMEYGDDYDITIASWQTLLRRKNIPKAWGLTIIDECHRVCSKEFSQIMFKANCKYVLGLSATPQRADGLTCVLNWHIGDVIFRQEPVKRSNSQTILYIKRYFEDEYRNLRVDGKNYTKVISHVTKSEQRNAFIVKAIKTLVYERLDAPHRRTLVLTDRVSHAKALQVALQEAFKRKTIGLFIGEVKLKDLIEAKKSDIIIATYKIFEEGESVEELNTLVLASPKREITQAVGRIYRKAHEYNPIIIDIADSILSGQAKARKEIIEHETNGHLKIIDSAVSKKAEKQREEMDLKVSMWKMTLDEEDEV